MEELGILLSLIYILFNGCIIKDKKKALTSIYVYYINAKG